MPISGFDLQQLGLKPGPIFKDIMNIIAQVWYEKTGEGKPFTKEEALNIAKNYIKNKQ